jgi:hypothetical protein
MSEKIEISLTDFIDFVRKSGSPKLSKVKEIKSREPYSPATDFYKQLREGITGYHEKNKKKSELDLVIVNLNDKRKVQNYSILIDGYKKFLGKKQIEWFDPPFHHWVINDLDIKINPELGLIFKNKKYIIKLYFKSEKLTKDRISQILALLYFNLKTKNNSDMEFAILDVRKNKLYCFEEKQIELMPLLEGEARSFEEIWNRV